MIPFCEQLSYGQDLCYFHRKQADGLIPVADRKIYFGPDMTQDYALCNRTHKGSLKLFKLMEKIVVTLAARASTLGNYLEFQDLKQVALTKLWALSVLACDIPMNNARFYIRRSVWIDLVKYSKKLKDKLDTVPEEECEDVCGESVDELYCRLWSDHWVACTVERLKGGLSKRELYVLENNVLTNEAQSVRKIAKRFHVNRMRVMRDRAKIMALLKGELYVGEENYSG